MASIIENVLVPVLIAIIILIAQFFLQPIIQKKIISKSELWKSKKEVFQESLSLVSRQFDSSEIQGFPGHVPSKDRPTTREKNEVLSHLYLVTKNEEIPKRFMKIIDKETNPAEISQYVLLLREELYSSKIRLNPETEMGIFLSKK